MTNDISDVGPEKLPGKTHQQNLDSTRSNGEKLGAGDQQDELEAVGHPSTPDEPNYPTGVRFYLILLTMSAVLVLGGLDNNIVATAVPSITDDFHTIADVGWYSSGYRFSTCAFQFVFGKLYTLFPIKRIFLIANFIFLFGSLLCATAATSVMLVVGRAVTGVGFAGIIGGCFTVLVHILPLHKRPLFTGIVSAVESMAVVAAPVVGGVLTQNLGWRWCFWINLPIGGVTLLLTFFLFPRIDSTSRDAHNMTLAQKLWAVDPVSNLLFIPGLTCLFIALSWAGTKYPWGDPKVAGLLATFGVLFIAFVYNQYRRGDSAAIPFRILKSRSIVAGFIFAMCTNSALNVLLYYLPTYWQSVRAYSSAKSGYMMIPIMVGDAVGMLSSGITTSLIGFYTPSMLLASVLTSIFAGLITTFHPDTDVPRAIIYCFFSGLGNGIGFSAPQTAVQTVLPVEDVSLGLAIMLFGQNFGPAVCIAIAQVIFTNQLSKNVSRLLPEVNVSNIEENGLTEIVNGVAPTQRAQLITGVSQSLVETWYLVIGLTCTTLVGALLMEWRSVKKKRA